MTKRNLNLIVVGIGDFVDQVRPVVLETVCIEPRDISSSVYEQAFRFEEWLIKHYLQEVFLVQVGDFKTTSNELSILRCVEAYTSNPRKVLVDQLRAHHLGMTHLSDFVDIKYNGRELFIFNH